MARLARELWPEARERRVHLVRAARRLTNDELRVMLAQEREEVVRAQQALEALEAAEEDYRVLVMEAAMRKLHDDREGEGHGDG